MAILETYSTIQLAGIISKQDEFTPFLTNLFCPRSAFFESEEIAFDKIFEDNTLAPYVSPLVAGKVNKKDGYSTMKFKVPYIKDKDAVKPSDSVKRKAGEAFTGSMSRQARIAAERVRLLRRHDKRISMRIEEQVSQLVQTGKVLCSGEGHEDIEVDFQMSAGNNITVTGGARWSQLNPSTDDGQQIIDDLESWAAEADGDISVAVFERSVWKHIIKFKAVRELRDTQIRGEDSTFSTAPNTNNDLVDYVGRLGTLSCWVYKGFYKDNQGNKQYFLDTGRLILSPARPDGVVAYGAIEDVEQGMTATRMFSKNWVNKDPSVEYLMSQSAPLAALADIDSIVTVQTDGGV